MVMDQDRSALVTGVISRAPQWIRHDLASKDAAVRTRAEETLTAMILGALGGGSADEGLS